MSVRTWDGTNASIMGTSDYNRSKMYKPLTCPGGYYVSKVEGNEWDGSVGYISSITCTNYLDPTKTVKIDGAIGYQNPGNKGESSPYQFFDCGPRGMTGVLFKAGTILDSLYPICGLDKDSWMKFDPKTSTLIGADANWPHVGRANSTLVPQWCQLPGKPAGASTFVTEISGQNPKAYEGRISSANFKCKDFTDINAVKNSPDRMADVCNNVDPLSAELAGAIPCPSYMRSYCSGSAAWSAKCSEYYGKNPGLAVDVDDNKFAFCTQGENYKDPKCLSFCDWQGSGSGDPDARPAYKSRCNDHYSKVCKGQSSDLCSCLNKPNLEDWAGTDTYPGTFAAVTSSKGASTKPQCYFKACRDNGYKIFANQTPSINCPTCLNSVNVTAQYQAAASVGDVVQQCGTSGGGGGTPSSSSGTNQSSSSHSTSTTTVVQSVKSSLAALPQWCIFVFGVLGVILIFWIIFGGSSEEESEITPVDDGLHTAPI